MFDVPSDDDVAQVVVTREAVLGEAEAVRVPRASWPAANCRPDGRSPVRGPLRETPQRRAGPSHTQVSSSP